MCRQNRRERPAELGPEGGPLAPEEGRLAPALCGQWLPEASGQLKHKLEEVTLDYNRKDQQVPSAFSMSHLEGIWDNALGTHSPGSLTLLCVLNRGSGKRDRIQPFFQEARRREKETAPS